jgi:hypothetical protein
MLKESVCESSEFRDQRSELIGIVILNGMNLSAVWQRICAWAVGGFLFVVCCLWLEDKSKSNSMSQATFYY